MSKRNRMMHVDCGQLVPMHKHNGETMETNDSGCKSCGSLDSSEMAISVNGEDRTGIVCDECGETYVCPDSPDSAGKHCTEDNYPDDKDYSLFTGKPENKGFKRFRSSEGKRRDKSNKPQRTGRDMSFLDD